MTLSPTLLLSWAPHIQVHQRYLPLGTVPALCPWPQRWHWRPSSVASRALPSPHCVLAAVLAAATLKVRLDLVIAYDIISCLFALISPVGEGGELPSWMPKGGGLPTCKKQAPNLRRLTKA